MGIPMHHKKAYAKLTGPAFRKTPFAKAMRIAGRPIAGLLIVVFGIPILAISTPFILFFFVFFSTAIAFDLEECADCWRFSRSNKRFFTHRPRMRNRRLCNKCFEIAAAEEKAWEEEKQAILEAQNAELEASRRVFR